MYESFCILKTLAFGNHFCGSFGKPKNGEICMSLCLHVFLTLLSCLFFDFELFLVLCHHET